MDDQVTGVSAEPEAQPAAVTVEGKGGTPPQVTITRGQKGAQKTALVKFGGDHDGLWAKIWTNPKRKHFRELNSGDEERSDTALGAMVLEHNFTDDEGKPLPAPLTYESLGELPHDLYLELGEGIGEAVKQSAEVGKRA